MYLELEPERYWQKNEKGKVAAKDKNEIYNRIMSDYYVASLKKDGEYCRFIYENGKATLTGRGVSTVTGSYVDNTEKLPHFQKFLQGIFSEGTCLIGEIYLPGKTSPEVRKIMGCLPKKSLERQAKEPLIFYIFDVWAVNGINYLTATTEERINVLEAWRPRLEKHPQIKVANYVSTPKEILALVEYAFANGEEGCVLSMKGMRPEPGKRTAWKTIKIKKEFESAIDCFFTGESRSPERMYTGKEIENWQYWEDSRTGAKTKGDLYSKYINGTPIEPVTRPYFLDWPGSLEIAVVNDKKEIISLGYVSSGLNDEIKDEYARNKDSFIKRPCLIQGMEFTKDGSIRHPKFMRFRDDINWTDCEWEKIF